MPTFTSSDRARVHAWLDELLVASRPMPRRWRPDYVNFKIRENAYLVGDDAHTEGVERYASRKR